MHRQRQEYKQLPTDEEGPDRDARLLKPSIYWLIPVFIVFNVSMGAISMPRTNLIISLTCRNVLSEMVNRAPSDVNIQQRQTVSQIASSGHSDAMAGGSLPGNISIADIIIGEHNDQCSIKEVESATAMLSTWGNIIAGILGAVMMPVWGRLSDRHGRVKALGAATAIMLLGQAIEVLMAVFPGLFTLKWIYASYIFEGLSGTFILIMAIGSAYAADCTNGGERSITMGLLHGSMYFGMAFGPVFGGLIGMRGGKSHPLVIFYTALAMNAFGVIYIIVLLPESLSPTETKSPNTSPHLAYKLREIRPANVLQLIQRLNPLRTLVPPEAGSNHLLRRNIVTFAALNTLIFTIVMGSMGVIMMYSEYTFKWNNQASGTFLSSTNVARTVALVVILPLVIRIPNRYTSSVTAVNSIDLRLIQLSIIADIVGYAGYALAPTGALFTISGVIASLDSIALATSEATLSKLAGKNRMGEVLGSLGFLQACARVLGPTVANIIYSRTVEDTPTLTFWVFVSSLVLAGGISFAAKVESEPYVAKHEYEEGVQLDELTGTDSGFPDRS